MNTEQLGRLVKQQYPNAIYSTFSDFEIGQKAQARYGIQAFGADGLIAAQNNGIQSQIPKHTSSNIRTMIGVVLIIGGALTFYNLWSFNEWQFFAAGVLSIAAMIAGTIMAVTAHKDRYAEYEHAKQVSHDSLELATKHQDFIIKLQNMAFNEAEREYKKAVMMLDLEGIIVRLRNELAVSDAARHQLLDPETYLRIREMQAQADINLKEKAESLKLDAAHSRDLSLINFEATRLETNLAIETSSLEGLIPELELTALNKQLANLYVELETIKRIPESDYKIQELKRIVNHMKALEKSIRGRQKRLA